MRRSNDGFELLIINEIFYAAYIHIILHSILALRSANRTSVYPLICYRAWWNQWDPNPRPLVCKTSALPD